MTDDPTPAIGIYLPARGRMRSKCEIRHADAGPCDCYAPHPKRCVCCDSTGYMRRKHAFVESKSDGVHCVWCGALRRMEPL